ncbi:MAG: beta-ketoacyl-ACP synthase III [Thermodesulfobacteriota bacterium]
MKHVRIIGTGSKAPDKILSNTDLEKMVETSDEWITARTGIKERRIAEDGVASSDMGYDASLKAIEAANIDPLELDVIIVGTVTPDYLMPSTGCLLQSKLGAKNAYGFDLTAGCSGFLFALHVGNGLIKSGSAKKILVVGTETLSRIMDYEDRSTCILFGDGAGAVVLSQSDEPGIMSSCLSSDGDDWQLLYIPGGGSRIPASKESIENKDHYMKMNGRDVFKIAVKSMESATIKAIEEAGIKPEDIDLLIPHQANYRILDAVRRRLDLPEERLFSNVDKYGNTSSASVPLALDEAVRSGRAKKGDIILFTVFGGGFTWGATVVRL